MARILVADDHAGLRDVMVETLSSSGHDVKGVGTGDAARDALDASDFDLLVTDLRMPGLDGLALLQHVKTKAMPVHTIVMTAHGTVETAVKAMHLGALDYVEKPFPLTAMEAKVKKALESIALQEENKRLRDEQDQHFGSLTGASPPMRHVFDLISRDTSSLPVPLSPRIRTGVGVSATRVMRSNTWRMGGDAPVRLPKCWSCSSRRRRFSS